MKSSPWIRARTDLKFNKNWKVHHKLELKTDKIWWFHQGIGDVPPLFRIILIKNWMFSSINLIISQKMSKICRRLQRKWIYKLLFVKKVHYEFKDFLLKKEVKNNFLYEILSAIWQAKWRIKFWNRTFFGQKSILFGKSSP